MLQRLIVMLQNSVKFILPNCCNLVEPDEVRQAHIDLMRLRDGLLVMPARSRRQSLKISATNERNHPSPIRTEIVTC